MLQAARELPAVVNPESDAYLAGKTSGTLRASAREILQTLFFARNYHRNP